MKKKLSMICTLMILTAACGGGSDSCSVVVEDFTNGANATVTENIWNCISTNSSFTFAFYDDGTGLSSALGAFTWEEVGCQELDVEAVTGTNHVTNAAGSIASGILTFTQTLGSTSIHVSCTLGTL